MSRARVVFPEPGGPQKIMEPTAPRSIASRSGFPAARRCCWPTNSSSARGRIRAASGGGVRAAKRDSFSSPILALERRSAIIDPLEFVARRAVSSRYRARREIQAAAQQKGRRNAPSALCLKFGNEIGGADVERHPGRHRQPILSEKCELVGEQHAKDRCEAECGSGKQGAAAARSRCQEETGNGESLGKFVQENRRKDESAQPLTHAQPARDSDAVG